MKTPPLFLATAVLAAVLLGPGTGLAGAQEILTNEAVVLMKQAGLSEAVILAKIRSSQSRFDVGTQALVDLKKAGLSDAIIEAMVSHTGPVAGTTTSAVSRPPAGALAPAAPAAGRQAIFHVTGDTYVELATAVAEVETNFAFFQTKSELVLKSRRAGYRTAERTPVFLSPYSATEAPLVRLKPGDSHDDRNLKISSGFFAPFHGTQRWGVRNEDRVDVDVERDPRGFYRIKPRGALAPGEYAFVITHGLSAGAASKVYDFGVD
jgi:hypothetical protein